MFFEKVANVFCCIFKCKCISAPKQSYIILSDFQDLQLCSLPPRPSGVSYKLSNEELRRKKGGILRIPFLKAEVQGERE